MKNNSLSLSRKEFHVVKEITEKLGLENLTDGSLAVYRDVKHTKPDGRYEYKDIIIVLDAKAEGKKYADQLKDYLNAEHKLNPKKNVFGIFYNGTEHYVYLNSMDNLLIDAKILGDKEYYYNLAHNKELNKTEIYSMTRSINETLHQMGLGSLLDRMVWTVCVLVACREKKITNVEASYKEDVKKYLQQAISNDLRHNDKLQILIQEFDSIHLNHDQKRLENALNIIDRLSDLLNSSKWRGEDIGAIFFNEFTRYKGKAQDGQVFTPEIWTSFIYKFINCNHNDKILDAACGSAGFLVKAMNLMTNEAPEKRVSIQTKQLFGIEWIRKIYTVACANMLLHKDGKTNIIQGDSTNENPLQINDNQSIKNVGDWIRDKKITKVLMNPPFEKSTGIKILKNILDNVEPNADVAFILPDRTLLTKSQNIVKQILNKHKLVYIVKMPEETWRGLAGITTSIFVFKSNIPHQDSDVIKYHINDDGLQTVKNSGRHDINRKWENELEPYWLDIIKNNKDHISKQVSKSLEYEIPREIKHLTEADFDKVILDRLLFENPEIKEKVEKIKEKVEKIKEKDWLLWSLKSPRKKGDE